MKAPALPAYLTRWHTYRPPVAPCKAGSTNKHSLSDGQRAGQNAKGSKGQNGKRGSEVNYAVPNTDAKRKEGIEGAVSKSQASIESEEYSR